MVYFIFFGLFIFIYFLFVHFLFVWFIFCLFIFCLFIFLFVYFLLKLTELETAEEKKQFEKCFRWNRICWSLISKTSTVDLSDHNEFITMNDLRNHLVNHCSKVRKIGYNSFVFLFVYFILYKLINIFFLSIFIDLAFLLVRFFSVFFYNNQHLIYLKGKFVPLKISKTEQVSH